MLSLEESSVDARRFTSNSKSIEFGPWHISYDLSCILPSVCSTKVVCERDDDQFCQFCVYCKELAIPHFPDMVFPKNVLSLTHKNGANINFNPLDALKLVAATTEAIEVSCAEVWQGSSTEENVVVQLTREQPFSLPNQNVKLYQLDLISACMDLSRPDASKKKKSFDWTFSTNYKGTLNENIRVEPTDEDINYELLKQKDQILFYHDLTLFEDELHDHGISKLSVKIRVMPTHWFVLLRYFLRVDDVMVRSHETRMFHMLNSNCVIREYTAKESKAEDLKIPTSQMKDAEDVIPYLQVKEKTLHKLVINADGNSGL